MKNARFMVACRQFNQWCRRVFIRCYGWTIHGCIHRLRQERDWLTCLKLRTDLDLVRLRRINWLLGTGGVISLTQAERDEQDKIATEILKELANDGKEARSVAATTSPLAKGSC